MVDFPPIASFNFRQRQPPLLLLRRLGLPHQLLLLPAPGPAGGAGGGGGRGDDNVLLLKPNIPGEISIRLVVVYTGKR